MLCVSVLPRDIDFNLLVLISCLRTSRLATSSHPSRLCGPNSRTSWPKNRKMVTSQMLPRATATKGNRRRARRPIGDDPQSSRTVGNKTPSGIAWHMIPQAGEGLPPSIERKLRIISRGMITMVASQGFDLIMIVLCPSPFRDE